MKNKAEKVLKSTLAASFAFSLITTSPVQILAAPQNETKDVTVDVYPQPQDMSYLSNEGMSFVGEVNVVLHGEQEEATLAKLEALLKENGIKYVISDAVDESKANILISSSKDHCAECSETLGGVASVLNEEQGYILNASNDNNPKGEVKIVGADSDGAYYGLMTLAQMMEQETAEGKIAETVISDYPSIKLRGYVEGFYGYPWSFEDRLSLMSDSSKYKMNTYIYAPKDDPYHKDNWRDLYPADKAEELRQLAQEGKKDNVSFCWSVHPGNGFNYSNDDDYNKLLAKFEQLYDLGVRQFGISYDDLGGYVDGNQHANIINRVNRDFVKVKGDVKPLIVVATRYCNGWGPSMSGYFKPFYNSLDEDVVVMWTGANTMSAITKEAYEWPKREVGSNKDLAAWWNYPVNDYCDGNLMMSPLENLDNDVDNLSGFFLNPMSQAEASKVAIFSGADYSWNVTDFEKTRSWKRAIDELVPEASEAFQRFADNISYIKDGFEFDESRYLVAPIDNFKTALQTKKGVKEAATALKAEFVQIEEDVAKLRTISDTNLLEEIEQHLKAYEAVAKAGVASMDAFIAAENGDIDACLTNMNTLEIKLNEAQTYTVTSLETNGTKENVVKVFEKRVKPLLKDSLSQIKSNLMENVFPQKDPAVITTVAGLENKEIDLNKGNYEINNIIGKMKANDHVGIALPKAMKLAEVKVTSANNEALEVQYSINGLEWHKATATVENGTLKATIDTTATYVKVVNKTAATIDANIAKITIKPIYNTGKKSITTDLGTYGNHVIDNALDGSMATKFYSSAGATVGSYVRVDLGKEIPLYDVEAYFAGNPKGPAHGIDGFAATKLEISTDGVTWRQVGDVIKDENYTSKTVDNQLVSAASYNAQGEMARYIRFSATEASSNWVQVFEVVYNKTVDILGDDTVDLVDTTIPTGDVNKLFDRDLTSAYAPESVSEGDSLTYAMSAITNVGKLIIMQDPTAISKATVSIKDASDNWSEIGILDAGTNSFDINKQIVDVKLTFHDGNPAPVIYEIIAREGNPVVDKVDKTALKIAIEMAENVSQEQLDKVIPIVLEKFNTALTNARAVYANDAASVVEVDAAFNDLAKAMSFLEFYQGDKTALRAFVEKTNNLEEAKYLANTWAPFANAMTKANEVLADTNAMQDEVNTTYNILVKAFLDLRLKPNKDALKDLIAQASTYKKADYSVTTFAALTNAIDNAKAVLSNENATSTDVANAHATLTKAINALEAVNASSIKPGDVTPSVKTGDSTSMVGAIGLMASVAAILKLKKRRK